MEKILLVEPNYKNKYPPIGLMKISSYFKSKGDFVVFHKGVLSSEKVLSFDKVFVTTLFTFDYDTCLNTINYYVSILGRNKVYIGGIAATIMPEKFMDLVATNNLLTGQLTNSSVLGYSDNINIDLLQLDYDILHDIEYKYPAADSYFIYTTRGCPRKCKFCAVQTLEPKFYECANIIEQIEEVDSKFGTKKNLLIMDNNILFSENYFNTIDLLKKIGFGKNKNKIKKSNKLFFLFNALEIRLNEGRGIEFLFKDILEIITKLYNSKISENAKNSIDLILPKDDKYNIGVVENILSHRETLEEIYSKYHYHNISRNVDFNQGLDARFFTKEKANKMGEIAIRPCRIAFDDIKDKEHYFEAMENAVSAGITNFSNYLLYNYNDKPEDLWQRLNLNIQFCKKYKDKKISLFSFPMKYAAIDQTDRKYIGVHWNKKYLRAINVILNVTSGIVAKEEDFFQRAYGKTSEEFMDILMMPDDFIRNRIFFEDTGLTDIWRKLYRELSAEDKESLLMKLIELNGKEDVFRLDSDNIIDNLFKFYYIKKKILEDHNQSVRIKRFIKENFSKEIYEMLKI